MVEFAIILPVFIILIFGIIEFSILLYNKGIITHAAREGARSGVVYNIGDAIDIESEVSNYINDNLISFSSSKPTPDIDIKFLDENDVIKTGQSNCPDTTSSKDKLRVRVSYPYSFLVLPNFVTELAGGVNLESQAVMVCE